MVQQDIITPVEELLRGSSLALSEAADLAP